MAPTPWQSRLPTLDANDPYRRSRPRSRQPCGRQLQAEMNARMRQCHAVDGVANMAQLGGRRLEKLFSCRRVEKNLLDLDGCADGNCRRSNLVLLSAIDPQAISHWRARYTRQNLHLGYRTDARQRLAAKSQGGDAKQIVIVLELARRMTLNCKIQVLCSHSFAVVGDANQRCAASFNPNKNLRCAGVERVLDQLFDHRRRALDHFTGSDAACYCFGQDLNFHLTCRSRFDNNVAQFTRSR